MEKGIHSHTHHSFTRMEVLQPYCKMLKGKARAVPEQKKTCRHAFHQPVHTPQMMERVPEGHIMGPEEKAMFEVDLQQMQEAGPKLSTVPISSQPC